MQLLYDNINNYSKNDYKNFFIQIKKDKQERIKLLQKENTKKHKQTLNQKLSGIISTVLVLIIAAIIIATYEGLDMVFLAYSAIDSFFASYEIEDA